MKAYNPLKRMRIQFI